MQTPADITGIYTDLPNEQYHDMEGLSSSQLRPWQRSVLDGVTHEKQDDDAWSPAYDVGNMIHDAVFGDDLEYEYVWYNKTKGRDTIAYRETCRDEGVIGIMPDDIPMIQTIRRRIDESPAIDEHWITGGHAELTFFDRDPETGHLIKIRPDYTVEEPHEVHVTEFKTVRSRHAPPGMWRKHLCRRNYDLSASMYADVVERMTGKPVTYRWIVAAKAEPYKVWLYELEPEDRQTGRIKYRTALLTREGWEQGLLDANGYQTEPLGSELPDWNRREAEGQLSRVQQTIDSHIEKGER